MKNFKGEYTQYRAALLDAIETPGKNNEVVSHLRRTLPKTCFVRGNRAVFDMDAVKKYLVSEDDISFELIAAKRWRKEVVEFDSPYERYEALRAVSLRDFGAALPKEVAMQIAKIMGIDIKKSRRVSETDEIREYVFDMIEGITRGEAEAKEAILKGTPNDRFVTKLESNMVKNVNRLIGNSKSKALADKNVRLVADPSLDVTKATIGNVYGNFRPDMILSYDEDGERKNVLHEHYGWKGSQEYNDKQMEKMHRAVDAGLAIFVSFRAPSYNHLDMCHPDECSLFRRVWEWNLGKTYYSPDKGATAAFKALYGMMEYAGLKRYIPAIEDIYFEN